MANVYGPRQRAGDGVVASFARSAADGVPAMVTRDGRQTRVFVFVEDVADADRRLVLGRLRDGVPLTRRCRAGGVGRGSPTLPAGGTPPSAGAADQSPQMRAVSSTTKRA